MTPRERRQRAGLGLRQCAEYARINPGQLSLYERGRFVLSEDQQQRLERVLVDFEGVLSKRGPAPYLTPEEKKQRTVARTAVGKAVKRGDLRREPCERCGAEKTVAHHRFGYDDPLRVVWLCGSCHGYEHLAMNAGRVLEANQARTARVSEGRRELVEKYGPKAGGRST